MCSHFKAMGWQYTRNEQNQYSFKCTALSQIYWTLTAQRTAMTPKPIKIIKENVNMTKVSHCKNFFFLDAPAPPAPSPHEPMPVLEMPFVNKDLHNENKRA